MMISARPKAVYDEEQQFLPLIGDVLDIVEELRNACQERGLTLSRWQTSNADSAPVSGTRRYWTTVTYFVHTGERKAQSRHVKGVRHKLVLHSREGFTEDCLAYKRLSELLEQVRQLPSKEAVA